MCARQPIALSRSLIDIVAALLYQEAQFAGLDGVRFEPAQTIPVVDKQVQQCLCACSVISGGLTLLGYMVAESFQQPEDVAGSHALGHNARAVAFSLFLIGFFMMLNRRKALTQVLALLSLENGLFLAALSLTYGMPLIVELGVSFDVLVTVLVLGILVFRIRESFESMDVSRLRRLRG